MGDLNAYQVQIENVNLHTSKQRLLEGLMIRAIRVPHFHRHITNFSFYIFNLKLDVSVSTIGIAAFGFNCLRR